MTPASTTASFAEAVHPLLNIVDENLALDGVPVHDRPIRAAWTMLRDFTISIRVGDDEVPLPVDLAAVSATPWFKGIYAQVEQWYVARYGNRLNDRRQQQMRGVTVVASTPFELDIPMTLSRVEVEGETAWLSFPDVVGEGESVLEWVVNPPAWTTYSADAQTLATENCVTVATLLRRISCRLTGADIGDAKARNLLAGVRIHLHSAAGLIMREDVEGSFARAQWELQMACESAYKGLSQQRNGAFPETHDLFVLHDRAELAESAVAREWLHVLPRWHEAANLRYGLGDHPTLHGIFQWYQTTLKVVAGALTALRGHDLSQASMLIAMAPWLRDRVAPRT